MKYNENYVQLNGKTYSMQHKLAVHRLEPSNREKRHNYTTGIK